MSLAEKVGTGEVVELDPASLKYGPKVRRERIDLDNVSAIEPFVENCPPIKVRFPQMEIIDGHHRRAAAERRGLLISAVLVECSDLDALELAARCNAEHGLALSASERKSLASRFLNLSDWSDRRVALASGLAPSTVAEIRSSVQPAESRQLDRRRGKDGKRRPTSPATQRDEVDNAIQADPAASARSIARQTGASPTTVANRKAHLSSVPAPEADAPPTMGEMVPMAPVVWKDEPTCERSNASREFARFMDHFTTWNRKAFYEWIDIVSPACPAELRREAISVAGSMSAAWSRLATDLSKPTMQEASR